MQVQHFNTDRCTSSIMGRDYKFLGNPSMYTLWILCIKEAVLQRDRDNLGVGYSHWDIVYNNGHSIVCMFGILLQVCTFWFLYIIVNKLLLSLNCMLFAGTSGYSDP